MRDEEVKINKITTRILFEIRVFSVWHNMILVAVKTWKYNSDDINLARTQESIVDELKIMVRVEEKRQLSYDKTFSQFVIQLIGCGLTPTVVDQHPNGYTTHTEGCPFLVLEYAEVQYLFPFKGFSLFSEWRLTKISSRA